MITKELRTETKQRLPLHAWHAAQGAKFISFGDWEVPAYYTSILEEHACVRERAGIFDISHMGQITVEGPSAKSDINRWITNNAEKLMDGKALYSPMCNEQGGIVDDIIVYQVHANFFLLVVNAANVDVDFSWIHEHKSPETSVKNLTVDLMMFSVQGPVALDISPDLLGCRPKELRRFNFYYNGQARDPLWVLRTGYTGEDGYEVVVDERKGAPLWHALMEAGKTCRMPPIGFGARDTLRLEAAYRLHGHDMDETTTPFEAGLGWTVDLEKAAFFGQEALLRQDKEGLKRKLAGFMMDGRVVARTGYPVFFEGRDIGRVTSGSFSPTLNRSIGLAYLKAAHAEEGAAIQIRIRNIDYPAKVVNIPFYTQRYRKL